jgi:hypothetical protein
MMKMSKRSAVAIVFATALSALGATSASATTTYYYVGNDFTTVDGDLSTANFVTIQFSLPGPLGDNLPAAFLSPSDWVVSDEFQTITDGGIGAPSIIVQLSTGPTGLPIAWSISATQSTYATLIESCNDLANCLTNPAADDGYVAGGELGFGSVIGHPGLWSTSSPSSPSATPLPAALPLFATGLGGLGLLGWRRKRKNTAALAVA